MCRTLLGAQKVSELSHESENWNPSIPPASLKPPVLIWRARALWLSKVHFFLASLVIPRHTPRCMCPHTWRWGGHMLSPPLPSFGPAVSFSASVTPLCPDGWNWFLLLYIFFVPVLNPFLPLKPVAQWLVHLSVCPLDHGCSRQGTRPVNGGAYGGDSICHLTAWVSV